MDDGVHQRVLAAEHARAGQCGQADRVRIKCGEIKSAGYFRKHIQRPVQIDMSISRWIVVGRLLAGMVMLAVAVRAQTCGSQGGVGLKPVPGVNQQIDVAART